MKFIIHLYIEHIDTIIVHLYHIIIDSYRQGGASQLPEHFHILLRRDFGTVI